MERQVDCIFMVRCFMIKEGACAERERERVGGGGGG